MPTPPPKKPTLLPLPPGPGVAAKRARDRALTQTFRTAGRLAPLLPDTATTTIAKGATGVLERAMRRRRLMVERHQRRALGPEATAADVDDAVEQAFASYARYWVETFRLGGLTLETVEDIFTVEPREFFLDTARSGGCILALPHLGQWEVAGAWVGLQGLTLTTVVEELDPPELFAWFKDLRERRFGMNVLSASDPTVYRKLLRGVQAGDCVALLADRDLAGTGVEVEFFGETTTLPPGPAHLAISTGAPLLPVAVYETGDWRYRAVVRPPLPVPAEGSKHERVAALTQAMAYELEGLIRRAPSQWHLFQPNWPSDREVLAAAAPGARPGLPRPSLPRPGLPPTSGGTTSGRG